MATGTEFNDNLTNDPSISPETVDALGGDDVITIQRPNFPAFSGEKFVQVNGGSGFDTLIISTGSFILGSASGFEGSLRVREGSSVNWYVNWSSIERLELTAGGFFNSDITLGDEVDIVRMTPGFGGRINTAGGNDEVYFTGSGSSLPVAVDAGTGNDLVDLSGLAYFGNAPPPSDGGPPAHQAYGGEGQDVLRGSAYRDYLDGGAGADTLYAHYRNASNPDSSFVYDRAFGGAGNDIFFFGADLSQYDVVNGGADYDTLVVQGDYAGGLTLSANVTQIEAVSILAGSNTTLGESGSNRYDYVITTNDANVAAGVQLKVNGANLAVGEDFTFNGTAETDGHFVVYGSRNVDTLTGGFGNDIFIYAEERFAPGDTVNGGPGGYDGLFFRGNYIIDFNAPGYHGLLTSIENITLSSATDERYARGGGTQFDYNLTLADSHLAAGVELTVSGNLLTVEETMILDASQESDGFLRLFGGKANDTLKGGGQADTIHGNVGADQITGNGGADIFRYDTTSESDGLLMDRINDMTPGTDKIDLSRIDSNILVEGNQAFTYIGTAAFSGAAGELRIENLNGFGWFLMGDTSGDGRPEFLVQLTLVGSTPLSASDFIL